VTGLDGRVRDLIGGAARRFERVGGCGRALDGRPRWERRRQPTLRVVGMVCLVLVFGVASGGARASSVLTERLLPDPSPRADASLGGISCVSATVCTAVGRSWWGPLVERWDGSAWSVVPTPSFAGSMRASLGGVSCTSRSRCVAVGWTNKWPLVERWNGSRWSVQATPHTRATRGVFLNGVSCTAKLCMAVGGSGDAPPIAARWDGRRWSIEPFAVPPQVRPSDMSLNAVACVRSGVCIAVGGYPGRNGCDRPLVERWDGKRWLFQHSPDRFDCASETTGGDAMLTGVSCVSATMCLAVGAFTPQFKQTVIAQHWNGRVWSEADSNLIGQQADVSCVPGSCTVVSDYGGGTARWNGRSWFHLPVHYLSPEDPGLALYAVSCRSATVCLAVGDDTLSATSLQVPVAVQAPSVPTP
jgi:hypothetical protein